MGLTKSQDTTEKTKIRIEESEIDTAKIIPEVVTPPPDVPRVTRVIPFEDQKTYIKKMFVRANPRFENSPTILNLVTEIIHYRYKSKKKKGGYVQATINQLNFGFQVPEDWEKE